MTGQEVLERLFKERCGRAPKDEFDSEWLAYITPSICHEDLLNLCCRLLERTGRGSVADTLYMATTKRGIVLDGNRLRAIRPRLRQAGELIESAIQTLEGK